MVLRTQTRRPHAALERSVEANCPVLLRDAQVPVLRHCRRAAAQNTASPVLEPLTSVHLHDTFLIKWQRRSYQVIKHPHEGFKLLLADQPLRRGPGALPRGGLRGAGLGFVLPRVQED